MVYAPSVVVFNAFPQRSHDRAKFEALFEDGWVGHKFPKFDLDLEKWPSKLMLSRVWRRDNSFERQVDFYF